MKQPKNVIFWGAGATARLGIRITDQQTQFIKDITGASKEGKPLAERIAKALGSHITDRWHSALYDLITVLGDADDNYNSIDTITDEQTKAMGRNWQNASDPELKNRIINLRLIYDWPALKSLVSICPGSSSNEFKLNDLFNLLDLHIPPGFGVRAPAGQLAPGKGTAEVQFFDARRLIGAKNALRMILIALFYIDWHDCIRSKRNILEKYHDFAIRLGQRMQIDGIKLAQDYQLNQPEFYQGDIGFVSLNYDPIVLWMQFIANHYLNKDTDVPRIGPSAVPLNLFHDFGHLIPARGIDKPNAEYPWYPMNEAAAQRINKQELSDSRVRLTKFLFPHGCLCWRECPDCRKLSAYHGDQWDLDAQGLFPPPPLRAFDTETIPGAIVGDERAQREKGAVDARACLHCGTLTYAHHTQTVMQSSFKSPPPSFIEEIQRELRAITMQAKHLIFMGYSLPPDDVGYRALFAATRQRDEGYSDDPSVHCTIVGWDRDNLGWYGPAELAASKYQEKNATVRAAIDIFGADKVRFFGGGVPDVFLDGGIVTDAKLEQLLTWSSTP